MLLHICITELNTIHMPRNLDIFDTIINGIFKVFWGVYNVIILLVSFMSYYGNT